MKSGAPTHAREGLLQNTVRGWKYNLGKMLAMALSQSGYHPIETRSTCSATSLA